jgi:hypothetical protein
VAPGAVDVAEAVVVMAAAAAAMVVGVAVVAEAATAAGEVAAETVETAVIVGKLSFKILWRRHNPSGRRWKPS